MDKSGKNIYTKLNYIYKTMSIKILYVITQNHWGGAQKYIYDLATNLPDSFEIHVAIGAKSKNESAGLIEKIKNSNYKITLHQIDNLIRSICPKKDIAAIKDLRDLYKKLKPDIVHLNSSKASVIGSLAKLENTKIVYTAHGWVFNEPMPKIKKSIYKMAEKHSASKKDLIITLSDKEYNQAIKILKIKKEKLQKIHIGVPEKKLLSKTEAKQKLKLDKNKKLIFGTIANFYHTKGYDLLLKALKKEKNNLKDAQFLFIGDGPKKNEVEKYIEKNNLKNLVTITGFVNDASSFIKAFDFFVLPSRKEGLPYTILESMVAKVPIIATNVGGNSEIIENKKTGLLIPPESINDLSQAILFAYKNKEQMEKMATTLYNAKKENYSLVKMLDTTVQSYYSILKP